jgi:hypothetical protein
MCGKKRSLHLFPQSLVTSQAKEPEEKRDTDDVDDDDSGFVGLTSPPPMLSSLSDRCDAALEHIVRGLAFLEVMASRRDEEEASEKKHQEQVSVSGFGILFYGKDTQEPPVVGILI